MAVQGARQQESSAALTSILKKMEAMLDSTNQVYQQQLQILSSIDIVQKNTIVNELKAHTTLLSSINDRIQKASEKGSRGDTPDKGSVKEFEKAFGSVAKVLQKLIESIKKMDDKAADKISNFFTKLAESINKFTSAVKGNAVENMSKLIKTVTGGVFLYIFAMILATPLLALTIPGAILFGLSIRLLFLSMGLFSPIKLIAMNGILSLAKGVLLYSLAMVVAAILSPVVLVGSILFGLSIRLLFLAMGLVTYKKIIAMEAVLSLAQGVILYSLAMVVAAILSPVVLIGSILFGLSVRLLFLALGRVTFKKILAMYMIQKLAKGILLYALIMVLVTLLMPIVLIGTIIFGTVLILLSFGLRMMGKRSVRRGVTSLILAGLAILLLGLAISLFGSSIKVEDILKVALTVGGLAIIFYFIGREAKKIFMGALAMMAVSLSIMLLSLGLLFFMKSGVTWEGIAMLGAVIVGAGLAYFIAGKQMSSILKGVIALSAIGVSLIIFSIGLAIYAQLAAPKLTWESIAMLGAVIITMGLIATVLGIGPIPGFAMAGAAVLIVIGAAFVLFSVGFAIFALAVQTFDSMKKILLMGATLVTLGASIAAVGFMAPFVLLGAAALVVAGAALIPISIGLLIFKKVDWKKGKDDKALTSAMGSVIDGFLGGKMPGGIFASIKFAAQAAARAVLLFVTVPPMILAGTALIIIAQGLKAFKRADFKPKDADNMEYAMASIVKAFSLITDKKRQRQLGINVDWMDFALGVAALSGAGNVLSSLAKGIQAFANLSVIEYEVVNAGTSKAKIVPKGVTKLTKDDFEKAAYGMAKVISSIAEPFSLVGRLNKGETTGNPLYDMVFGNNYVSDGITALSGAGKTISSLAQGVKDFANLRITEYEVINPGTKNAKLVPKKISKMTKEDLTRAGLNIGKITTLLGTELVNFGRWVGMNMFSLETAYEGQKQISKVLGLTVKASSDAMKIKDPQKAVDNVSIFYTGMTSLFDSSKDPQVNTKAFLYTKFANNTINIARQSGHMNTVAKSFERIAKSTKLIKDNVNGFDLKKLTLTDSMFNAIAHLSKNPEVIAKAIAKSMEESFDELIEALKEMAKGGTGGTGGNGIPDPPKNPQPAQKGPQNVNILNVETLAQAIARNLPT